MNNIQPLGGNKYKINDRVIDMDGLCIISNEEYDRLDSLGMLNDNMMCPAHYNIDGEDDKEWEAVAKYVANYSGFNIEEYINNYDE